MHARYYRRTLWTRKQRQTRTLKRLAAAAGSIASLHTIICRMLKRAARSEIRINFHAADILCVRASARERESPFGESQIDRNRREASL